MKADTPTAWKVTEYIRIFPMFQVHLSTQCFFGHYGPKFTSWFVFLPCCLKYLPENLPTVREGNVCIPKVWLGGEGEWKWNGNFKMLNMKCGYSLQWENRSKHKANGGSLTRYVAHRACLQYFLQYWRNVWETQHTTRLGMNWICPEGVQTFTLNCTLLLFQYGPPVLCVFKYSKM